MKKRSNIPLGIPLTIASLGTVAALAANKQLHACFGVLWVGLSLWHGWQHRKKLQTDACLSCFSPRKPSSALDRLLSSVELRSFLEGRIRLYSPCFVNQPALQRQVEEYITSFHGIQRAEINLLTGSLLIEYRPEELRKNPKLAAIEAHLGKISQRKA